MTDNRTRESVSISSVNTDVDNNNSSGKTKQQRVLPASSEMKQVTQSSNDKKYNSIQNNGKMPKNTQVDALESCSCQFRVAEDNFMDTVPFYKKCHHKFCYKVFIFALMLGLNIADLVSDWLLYRDVTLAEDGLVYGPPESSLRYALLAFSIIGSLTFTFEVINLWWEIFRKNPWIDSDLSSAITVWIEDVPQIIINVVIVACREEAISYFQLVKASVIILGALIRIAVSLFKYCSKSALHDLECAKENKESCRHVMYRVFIMIGLFITLAGAITIFIFTQSERNPNGSINFKVPHSVIDGEYDDQKYFRNVSMYFSHKLVDFNGPIKTDENINLLKIALLNDIRKKDQDIKVTLTYETALAQKTKVIVSQTGSTPALTKEECFEIDRASETVTIGSNCQTYIPGGSPKSEIIFAFHFVQPNIPGLIFGDITYNVKEKQGGVCKDASFQVADNVSKRLQDPKIAAMHYFRLNEGKDGQHPTFSNHFYHISDLTDVTEVWKTGFAYCKSSGSVAPHLDPAIAVTC